MALAAAIAAAAFVAQAQAATWRSLSTPPGYIGALAVSPGEPGVVYVASDDPSVTGGGTSRYLMRSEDGGQSWIDLSSRKTTDALGDVAVLAVASNNPKRIYAASANGVFVSNNRGVSWRVINNGLPQINRYVDRLVVTPADPQTIYIAMREYGVHRSTDGGANWVRIDAGLGDLGPVRGLAVSPTDPRTVYVSYSASGTFFRTTDGGDNWTPIFQNVTGVAKPRFYTNISQVAVAPSNPNVVYAALDSGADKRVARSDDGGTTWTLSDGVQVQGSALRALAVDPHNPLSVYGAGGSPVVQSTADGQNWVAADGGVIPSNREIKQIAIAPWKTPVVYAASGSYLYRLGTPPAGAITVKVPAPTARVTVRGTGLRLTVTAALGKAAKGRTAQIQYQRGKRWIAAARVKVPASGRITRTVALTRAKIGGAKVRRLRVRVVLVKAGVNPAATGTVRAVRVPAR